MSDLDLLFQPEADARLPEVYNLSDLHTREMMVSLTPCYADHAQRSSECSGCPLADPCRGETLRVKAINDSRLKARRKVLQNALGEGFDLGSVKVPKKVRLDLPTHRETLANTSCVATGNPIPMGTGAVHLMGWGWIDSNVYDYLMDLKK